MNCSKCHLPMKAGFAARATGLSFIEPQKFKQFVFVDDDLSGTGPWRKVLPSKAEYYRAFRCEPCQLYTVDLSTVLDRAEAESASVENQA